MLLDDLLHQIEAEALRSNKERRDFVRFFNDPMATSIYRISRL